MSLKEFDAKQFLLEKGERVGLGVAVTLMVLMLILSLFLPGSGFFSGSPKTVAGDLNKITDQLETALRTRTPGKQDLPEEREGKLIALDTKLLDPDRYATENWFEPRMKENKARRPPKIYNVEEAVAQATAIPIDTYLFRLQANPPSILVLQDNARRVGGGNAPAAGGNPFAQLLRGMQGGRGIAPPSGSQNNPSLRGQQSLFGNNNLGALRSLQGAADNAEYEAKWVPLDNWSEQQQPPAHQLRPLRMAIICGSFPYKKQLEQHRARLQLKSTDEVLAETIGEGEKKSAAFDFRGVEVQRMEVDADGNKISDWIDPQLKESYQLWLQNTYYPYQEEDQKYALVKPNDGKGLVMPLLREFHSGKANASGLPGLPGFPGGMMMPGGRIPALPNQPQPNTPRQNQNTNTPTEEIKTRYPDVAAELPKLKETLDKLQEAQPKQIAQAKFQKAEVLDVFTPHASLPGDKTQQSTPNFGNLQGGANTGANANAEQSYVPDYVLVRVVDVTIDPGKHYKYRLKIKMANPNYQNPNVASPEYKEKETLESDDWYELPQTVSLPREQYYYVVDEAQGLTRRDRLTTPPESAQYRLLFQQRHPSADQVVMQFHRWVESTQQSRNDTDMIPVGEWAVADRVLVSRGEYIGRKVNVDIPIWKYTQNTFILPTEDQKKINRRAGKPNTGIDVDFGQDPPENNTILVDFEGGKGIAVPGNSKMTDDCAIEVLMLSPEGKLLARNSVKDTNDEQRKKRRDDVLKRIQDVREGKGTD
jgi:hypothetical protein